MAKFLWVFSTRLPAVYGGLWVDLLKENGLEWTTVDNGLV